LSEDAGTEPSVSAYVDASQENNESHSGHAVFVLAVTCNSAAKTPGDYRAVPECLKTLTTHLMSFSLRYSFLLTAASGKEVFSSFKRFGRKPLFEKRFTH
jgi:hypothetical protein